MHLVDYKVRIIDSREGTAAKEATAFLGLAEAYQALGNPSAALSAYESYFTEIYNKNLYT